MCKAGARQEIQRVRHLPGDSSRRSARRVLSPLWAGQRRQQRFFFVWRLVSRTWANFRIVAFWIRHPVEEGFDYFTIVNCCEEPDLGSGDSRLVLFGNVGLGLDTSAVKNMKKMRNRCRWAWPKTIYRRSCLGLLPQTSWSSPIIPAKRCKRCDAII